MSQQIRINRANELKSKYDSINRDTQAKKMFIMKRFAEVNARTNTHNKVATSMQNFQPAAAQEQTSNPDAKEAKE